MTPAASQQDPLSALTAEERERFEALAPYAGTAGLAPQDAVWLEACAARYPGLDRELAHHRALRRALHSQFAAVPEDVGLSRAMAQIDALSSRAWPAAPAPRGPFQALMEWLRPQPVWAVAFSLLVAPLAFIVGREYATPPYAQVRGTAAPGLFDGPLVRVNFHQQASEKQVRDALLEQGALIVGPTPLGDWFVKVKPARVAAVRAAMAQHPAVASAEVVPGLPAELLESP